MSLPGIIAVKRNLTEEVNDIVTRFHNVIFKIMKFCKQKQPDAVALDSLHRKLSLARDLDPLIIINRSKDKIWMYKDQIINEDEDFFINNKFGQFIKNDENKPFMYTMVKLIKDNFKKMSEPEKKMVWTLNQSLLKIVIEYKKITNDFV
jgi:hypothetical protein